MEARNFEEGCQHIRNLHADYCQTADKYKTECVKSEQDPMAAERARRVQASLDSQTEEKLELEKYRAKRAIVKAKAIAFLKAREAKAAEEAKKAEEAWEVRRAQIDKEIQSAKEYLKNLNV